MTVTEWLLLGLAAGFVGFAKTAISGAGSLAVVLFAAVLPAKESTGALLPLLLVGDVVAVSTYRRHASVETLLRLLPGVIPGLILGWAFLRVADDEVMRRFIGVTLLVMTALQLWQRRRPLEQQAGLRHNLWLTLAMGVAAGFATMTANAAGPVTTLYLIYAGLPMLALLGTAAWFYLVVNLLKVPLSLNLGLIRPESLAADAALVPALLLGAWIGIMAIRQLRQRQFETLALGLAGASAVVLML